MPTLPRRGPRSATPPALLLLALALTPVVALPALDAGPASASAGDTRLLLAPARPAGDVRRSEAGVLGPVRSRPADTVADSFGVGVHTAYGDTPYRNPAAVLGALRGLGVRHVRDDLFLDNPAQYQAISTLAAGGIDFDLIAGRPDGSATGDPQAYVDTIAADLPRGAVEAVEGPNEWDVSGRSNWADELRSYQRALYSAVHRAPALDGVPVLAPAMAFRGNYDDLGVLDGVADLANGHDYTGGRAPSFELADAISTVRRMSREHAVYVTEAGYHNGVNSTSGHLPVPENVSAVYEPRLLLDNIERGVKRVYSYELIDEFADPHHTDAEANFGLLRHDLSRKPAYRALRNLLALNADPGPAFTPTDLGYRVEGDVADVHQMLTQRRDGTWLLMLWRDVSIFDPTQQRPTPVGATDVTVDLPGTMRTALYHPTDSAHPVSRSVTSRVPVRLDGEVSVLELTPASGQPSHGHTTGHTAGQPSGNGRPAAPRGLRGRTFGPHLRIRWHGARGVTGYQLWVDGRRMQLPGARHGVRVRLHPRGRDRGARTVRVALRARTARGWGSTRIIRTRLHHR